jgi:hypothetical protein
LVEAVERPWIEQVERIEGPQVAAKDGKVEDWLELPLALGFEDVQLGLVESVVA